MRWVLNVIAEKRNSSVGSGRRAHRPRGVGHLDRGAVGRQRHRLGGWVAVDQRLVLAQAAVPVLVVLVLDDDEEQHAARPRRGACRAHGRHPFRGRPDAQVAGPLEPAGAPHPARERGQRRRGEPRVTVGTESGGRCGRREERPVPQRRQDITLAGRDGVQRGGDARDVGGVERGGRARRHAEVVERDLVGHRSGRSGHDAAVAQRGDLGGRQAEVLGEDLLGVLAEGRRRAGFVAGDRPERQR